MIPSNILEELVRFTKEEIDNLNGKKTIDRSIFLHQNSNIIDYQKLMLEHQSLIVRKHTRFMEYPKHRHNYIELMYVYGGKMTHLIDDEEITIHQGELLLLNQNIEHAIKYTNENDIIFNFIIPPAFLDFLSTMVEEDNEIFRFIFDALYSYRNDGEYLIFKVADDAMIRAEIETIITNIYRPHFNHTVTLKLLVGLLITRLMQYPEKIQTYTNNGYEKMLYGSILKYISVNYREGSLQALSKQLHQPDYKLCKIIKKETNTTFKQLIQQVRLKRAITLLRTTSAPIVNIMEEVGYENITYFYKIFKETYHMTPNAYRQSIGAKKDRGIHK